MRSRPLPTQQRFALSQSFPPERSHKIRPTGIVLAILSTFVAVPVLMSNGADGSQDHLAATISLPEASTSTSAPESTSSSLFEDSEGTSLFRAGAQIAVPLGETTESESASEQDPLGPEADSPATTVAGEEAPVTTLAPRVSTTVAPVTAPATTKAPTTKAPTTKAPTTQAPTTRPPATQVPTTQPATTAAPVTTAPAPTLAPTTAPSETTTSAAPATTAPSSNPTAEQWAQVRHCESSGNYAISTGNGYYGAYQFNLSTWDGVANGLGRSDLVGVKPSDASPADQDALALALWTARGPSPWPHCGRFLPPKP